jgi:uncharacterized membrane protein
VNEGAAPRWASPLTLTLCIAGVAVASYLTYAHYTDVSALACPDTGTVNCAKVTTSSQSHLLGIPVAVLGLMFFFAMGVICTPWAWRSPRREFTWARLAGVVAGVVMVVYLVYAELFEIDAICLWCTVVHVITFALFVAVVMAETGRVDVAIDERMVRAS